MACGQVALIATPASRTHVASAERPPVLFGTPGRQSWCARRPITKRPAAGLLSSDGQNSPEALDDFFIHSREQEATLGSLHQQPSAAGREQAWLCGFDSSPSDPRGGSGARGPGREPGLPPQTPHLQRLLSWPKSNKPRNQGEDAAG